MFWLNWAGFFILFSQLETKTFLHSAVFLNKCDQNKPSSRYGGQRLHYNRKWIDLFFDNVQQHSCFVVVLGWIFSPVFASYLQTVVLNMWGITPDLVPIRIQWMPRPLVIQRIISGNNFSSRCLCFSRGIRKNVS